MSATDPAVGAAKDTDGISAGDPPVDAAKDTPAIPSTDTALLGRFPLEARFACDIAEVLLYFPSNKHATHLFYSWHFSCALNGTTQGIASRSSIAPRQLSHLAPRCLHSLIESQAS